MSDNLAIRQPDELAHASPLVEWRAMREQAQALVRSGFLPRAINTPEKAIAVMQTGRELGIGPMQALRCVHIIDGKPTMAAELIAGLVLARLPGSTLRPIESTATKCIVEAARPGQTVVRFVWTIEDAKAAGLTSKDNWRKYPRAMLRSRAITEAARAVFPDATMGLYDPDELGAITNESGEVTHTPQPEPAPVQHSETEPQRSADPAPAAPRDSSVDVVPFGKNKGKRWSELTERQLQWYRTKFQEDLDDPSKERWHDRTTEQLEAVCAALDALQDPERAAIQEADGEVYDGQFE